MKLIKSSFEILDQKSGLEGIYEAIERAGRNCYKSERKEGTTAKDFVDKMIASKHYAMLEHGTVYLKVLVNTSSDNNDDLIELTQFYWHNPYSKRNSRLINEDEREYYITTNYRVLLENNRLSDLKYLCEPTEFHEKRVTIMFTSMIQFYKDLTRHRKMSYAIESTRYCNYSKDKFGNELTFIIPSWMPLEEGSWEHYEIDNMNGIEGDFLRSLKADEEMYLRMINFHKLKPQQAAKLLPQDTKADIIVTGFVSDWSYIFLQRTSIIAETGIPDTEVSLLMDPLYKEFIERKFI